MQSLQHQVPLPPAAAEAVATPSAAHRLAAAAHVAKESHVCTPPNTRSPCFLQLRKRRPVQCGHGRRGTTPHRF